MPARTNLRIGDVEVYFTPPGEYEVFLGQTHGGVEFSFEREFEDLVVDKYGNMPVDMALTGQNLLVKAFLAEMTTENISRAIPEGDFDEAGTDSKLQLGRDSGFLMSTIAGLLRLHPRRNDPDSRDEDIYIYLAVSHESVEIPYKIDEQRVLEVTWRALVDEDRDDGNRLGRVGDVDIS